MPAIFRVIFALVLIEIVGVPAAFAEKKVALVIGNAAYRHDSPLANPGNDAVDVAAVLKPLGFHVIEGRDLDKSAMDRLVSRFAQELRGADVGLFFYAGHGLQVNGQNFLMPVDSKLENSAGLEFDTVPFDAIQKTMERSAKTNLLFLDACRNNPLARNLARSLGTRSATIRSGLAQVVSGTGTIISFSTKPGSLADDGKGRNSPYAAALVRQLSAPKDDVSTILINVRNDVMKETRGLQEPWEHSALTARYYFSSTGTATPQGGILLPPVPSMSQQAELAFWLSVKDSRDPGVIKSYLDTYPNGSFAPLARVLAGKLEREAALERQNKMAEERRRAEEAERSRLALAAAARQRLEALKAAATPVLTGEALVREVQQELTRVGCDPGTVDGKWGAKARSALGDFAKRSKVALALEEPTPAALAALKAQKDRVCPLECDDGEVESNGRCVPAPARKKSSSTAGRSGQSGSSSPKSSAGKKVDPDEKCWDFAGRLVRCRDLGGPSYSR